MTEEVSELIRKLRSGSLEEQIQASLALSALGNAAVDPLIDVIRDKDARHSWWLAAEALGRIGNRRAVMPLIAMLEAPDSYSAMGPTRKYTAFALASLADPRAIPILITMLHEPTMKEDEDGQTVLSANEFDCETVEAAAGALVNIGEWQGIEAVLNQLLEGECWYTHRLDEWGDDQTFQFILDALASEDRTKRESAVALLGESGDRRATIWCKF